MTGAEIIREEAGTAEGLWVDAAALADLVACAEGYSSVDLSSQVRRLFDDEAKTDPDGSDLSMGACRCPCSNCSGCVGS